MRFVIYKTSTNYYQPYYWVIKAGNNEILATSEMYASKQSCLNAIDAVRTGASTAVTVDMA